MKHLIVNSAFVGIGGFAGAILRYLLTMATQHHLFVLPVGTLGANLIGCFLIGGIVQLSELTARLSPEARLLLATGLCGGLTTMSSMIYETTQFLREGEYLHAGIYLTATLIGSLILFFAGTLCIKYLFRSGAGIWN